MLPAKVEVRLDERDFASGALPALLGGLRELGEGELLALVGTSPRLETDVSTWARLTGSAVVESTPVSGGGVRVVVRPGTADLPGDAAEDPRSRLWLYTNFDCNLACDYCCVRSDPGKTRDWLPLETIRHVAAEARDVGFHRILVTGGEPFLRPDIDDILETCAYHLPTTVLTNGSLLSGPRRGMLERLPRDRLTFQVSLDSPEASRHDAHRGTGSWNRARSGIRTVQALGFRVRIAATLPSPEERAEMDRWLEGEGFAPEDRLVRPLALRGRASTGMALTRSDVEPELTVTARGVYWHPVGAADADFFVRADALPLAEAWQGVQEIWNDDRTFAGRLATVFHCA
ncbi:MAG: radical SAM protein [Thermoplasmata archaeon]|nr:radical SAM protein [Thermoplasmata archaeon]